MYKRLSGCGAGGEYLAVSPWGELYPCHQFDGNRDFIIGNVDEGITRPDLVKAFKDVNVYSKEECSKCFSRFFCSGGCAANSYNFTGGINDVYKIGCELQRKRIECALMIKAALADDDGDTKMKIDGDRALNGEKDPGIDHSSYAAAADPDCETCGIQAERC